MDNVLQARNQSQSTFAECNTHGVRIVTSPLQRVASMEFYHLCWHCKKDAELDPPQKQHPREKHTCAQKQTLLVQKHTRKDPSKTSGLHQYANLWPHVGVWLHMYITLSACETRGCVHRYCFCAQVWFSGLILQLQQMQCIPDGRSGFKPMSRFVLLNYVTRW